MWGLIAVHTKKKKRFFFFPVLEKNGRMEREKELLYFFSCDGNLFGCVLLFFFLNEKLGK